jgi:glutathione synthase/RimK-type ligase-like ATP-grasp enzyme
MRTIVVVSRAGDWPMDTEGVEVVLAHDYLTNGAWTKERGVRVFNLCRSYRYQTEGYYVSLLAAARRHRPFPDLLTVLDMKSRALVRSAADEIEELTRKSLGELRSQTFELSIYFGQNVAARHERLARKLFSLFPAPLMRAWFQRTEEGEPGKEEVRWILTRVAPIALRDVPESHRSFALGAAQEYFARPRSRSRQTQRAPYALAILVDPEEELAPSDPKALLRFERAATKAGFEVESIGRDDYGRLAEFDALFIRETTAVNHHTFRFAQRAEAEGLVVIDDPQSILRCTNKVFQTEALELKGVPIPKTWITATADPVEVERRIGFPCVLKVPDSAFSQGVVRCDDAEALVLAATRMLSASDLVLVQAYTPSDFDWRLGVFAGEPLYACRYFMARGHWQIVKKEDKGKYSYGKVETVPLEDVPPSVLKIGLKAASTIGDGLYGVDLKQLGTKVVVTEVNDNPNLNAGCEDAVLGDKLWAKLAEGFRTRVEARRGTR